LNLVTLIFYCEHVSQNIQIEDIIFENWLFNDYSLRKTLENNFLPYLFGENLTNVPAE